MQDNRVSVKTAGHTKLSRANVNANLTLLDQTVKRVSVFLCRNRRRPFYGTYAQPFLEPLCSCFGFWTLLVSHGLEPSTG